MNENRPSWLLVVGGGVLVGLLLVACVGAFLWLAGPWGGIVGGSRFESNGAQIYFTGTSRRGTPITAQMEAGMGRMRGSRLTCASCHGRDGRGGQVQMMMRIIEVSDIRYDVLTGEAHGEEEAHEPYTQETLRRAIVEGVEPDGEAMEWPMPRWSMSDEDLDDLVVFLKTLG